MTVVAILPTTPKIGLDLRTAPVLENMMGVGLLIADAQGVFPIASSAADAFNIGMAGGEYTEWQAILDYCGITAPSYDMYFALHTRDQVITAIKKWVVEVFIPAILKMVNKHVGTQAPIDAGGHYASPHEVLEDVLRRIKFTVGTDGKVSGTI